MVIKLLQLIHLVIINCNFKENVAAKDYYKILGVSKSSSADELKKADRKLAMKYHPDRNKGDKSSEARFKDISEAYAVLSDKEKRKQYDMFGSEGFQNRFSQEDIFRDFVFGSIFREFGFEGEGRGRNVFSHIFGGMGQDNFRGGGQYYNSPFGPYERASRPSKGMDITYELSLTLEEAFQTAKRSSLIRQAITNRKTYPLKYPQEYLQGKN